nr:MAG TPA: hypothetical protein [Caudoviricetes sp.]
MTYQTKKVLAGIFPAFIFFFMFLRKYKYI